MIKEFFIKNKVFIKDNFILFGSYMILNIMGYLFQFYSGRVLGPSDYGVFGSLLSIIYIIALPLNSIQTVITKFVSDLKVEKEFDKIAYLLKKSLKKISIIGIFFTIIFLLLSPFIASFLKIDDLKPIFVLSIFLFLGFMLPIVRGVLQGLQKFNGLGMSMIIEGISKIVFGITFIAIGFGVSGAIGGFVVSYIFGFLIAAYLLIKIFKINDRKFDTKNIYKYSVPVMIILVSMTLFYTIDVILVKHYLESVEAGYYAALSLLGKIIFFGTISVSMVMFSKTSESFANKDKKHKSLLIKSLLLVFSFGLAVTAFYLLFANFSVEILFGKEYLEIADELWIFAVAMVLFSLSYILAFYNMSLNRIKFVYLLIVFNILEAFLISLFHDSIKQVAFVMLSVMGGLFISLLLATMFLKNENIRSNTSI